MTTPTQELEQEIKSCGADVAPRITPDIIEANIASEHYFLAADVVAGGAAAEMYAESDIGKMVPVTGVVVPISLELLTFCVLVLKNGFTVTGESACASPENFNAEIGRKVARQNAVSKIWPLMGYALKEALL